MPSASRSSPAAGWGRCSTSWRAWSTAGRTPCWRPRSSTSASTPWARPRRCWPKPACRSARAPSGARAEALQVQAGGALDAAGGHGVDVALAQDQVVVPADFDLVAVVRGEQHLVADLNGAHVLADADDLAPHEPLGHLGGGGDEDAAGRAPLTVLAGDLHEETVVQHLDRKLAVVGRHRAVTVPSRRCGSKPRRSTPATASCSTASSWPRTTSPGGRPWCATPIPSTAGTCATTSSRPSCAASPPPAWPSCASTSAGWAARAASTAAGWTSSSTSLR